MSQYKSFRKKNRYKTLKYSHKNKRKNSHKNKYRVGRGRFQDLINSIRLRARTHPAPPPPLAEPIDDAMADRLLFLAEEERRLQREEEAPLPLPPPPPLPPPLPLPLPVLDIESERERKIESLLEETRDLLHQLDIVRTTTTNIRHVSTNIRHRHDRFLYIQAIMPTLRDKAHVLLAKLRSPDITRDYRISQAWRRLDFKLEITSRQLVAMGYE